MMTYNAKTQVEQHLRKMLVIAFLAVAMISVIPIVATAMKNNDKPYDSIGMIITIDENK